MLKYSHSKIKNRDERRKKAPLIYILKLTGKEKTKLNEEKIRKCKHIVGLSYKVFIDSDHIMFLLEDRLANNSNNILLAFGSRNLNLSVIIFISAIFS